MQNALQIPTNCMEAILCSAFKDIVEKGLPVEEALRYRQIELEQLFKTYGYPKPVHIRGET